MTGAAHAPDGDGLIVENPDAGTEAEHYRRCNGRRMICPSLRRRVQDAHHKGFVILDVVNFKTGRDGTPIVAYKQEPHDRGIVLNYCPFCGCELNLEYRKGSKSE